MSECHSVTSRLQFSSRCRIQECNFRGRAFIVCGAFLQAALSRCGSGCTSGLWRATATTGCFQEGFKNPAGKQLVPGVTKMPIPSPVPPSHTKQETRNLLLYQEWGQAGVSETHLAAPMAGVEAGVGSCWAPRPQPPEGHGLRVRDGDPALPLPGGY